MSGPQSPIQSPPNHPLKTLFRVFLWLLPTFFVGVMIYFLGFSDLRRILPSGLQDGAFGYALAAAFTLGAGWYNALLSNEARLEPDGVFRRTILFFAFQHLLVPLLLGVLLFAACLVNPIHF